MPTASEVFVGKALNEALPGTPDQSSILAKVMYGGAFFVFPFLGTPTIRTFKLGGGRANRYSHGRGKIGSQEGYNFHDDGLDLKK